MYTNVTTAAYRQSSPNRACDRRLRPPLLVTLLLLLLSVMSFSGRAFGAWDPIIGIPQPPFGVNETAPSSPSPWTTETAGFYYVCADCAGATDSGRTYGTPSAPRATIPRTLPAGSVVELRGTYAQNHTSPNNIVLNGTAGSPVFIRGNSPSDRPTILGGWEISGSYFILENLEFSSPSTTASNIGLALGANYAALRNSELHGSLNDGGLFIDE